MDLTELNTGQSKEGTQAEQHNNVNKVHSGHTKEEAIIYVKHGA